MHEFNGMNYFNGKIQSFWDHKYQQPFHEFLYKYHHHVVFITSAHIHRMELRNHQSKTHPNINISQIVSSASSPVYTNNPGYSTLEIWQSNEPKQKIKFTKHTQNNFQLQYYTMTGDVKSSWRIEHPKELYGLDLNNATSLRMYDKMFRSVGHFGAFMAFEFGFDKYFREIIGRKIIMPFFVRAYDSAFMIRDLCSMMWFRNNTDFHTCYLNE